MALNKKIIAYVSLVFIIIISAIVVAIFNNRQAPQKTTPQTLAVKNSDTNPDATIKNNGCKMPKRNDTKCSELAYQECKNNNMCYLKHGSCLTPPQSYIDTLAIIKDNCQTTGGEWDNGVMMYLNKFGGCKCPKGSKQMFPDDGFCKSSLLDVVKKKKLPEEFYRYYDQLHDGQKDFYQEPSEDKIVNDTAVDPLIVSLHSDYNNMDEAEYIACLYGGKVVGRVFLIDGYQIEFGSNTEEEAETLADKIENEPTVDFVMMDVVMSDDMEYQMLD